MEGFPKPMEGNPNYREGNPNPEEGKPNPGEANPSLFSVIAHPPSTTNLSLFSISYGS
jgi:hypothetical protein